MKLQIWMQIQSFDIATKFEFYYKFEYNCKVWNKLQSCNVATMFIENYELSFFTKTTNFLWNYKLSMKPQSSNITTKFA